MKTVKLNLKKRSYKIIIGSGLIRFLGEHIRALNIGRDAYVITNKLIRNNYGRYLESALKKYGFSVRFKIVADSEKSKSIITAASVIKDIALYDQKKRIFIIAFGGGVIGDLAGFVAAIYKRGIPYIQVPTTFLAQVDSSIGGKTALDLSAGKNLVGAIYQPRMVYSDTAFLKTLEPRQLRAALAEVIKYAAIKDKVLFRYLEKNYKDILAKKAPALEFIVGRCSGIKAKIVELDEKEEKGIRTILNFGHTIGHAIEGAGNFKNYNHGEAVALGMLAACAIGRELGITHSLAAARVKNLIALVGLPVKINKIPLKQIIKTHYRDKKFIGSRNRFVLIEDLGRTKIAENIPLEIIERNLQLLYR